MLRYNKYLVSLLQLLQSPDAIAGSIFNFVNIMGNKRDVPIEIIVVINIAIPNISAINISFQNIAIMPKNKILNAKPNNKLILISLKTYFLILKFLSKANDLIKIVCDCVPTASAK